MMDDERESEHNVLCGSTSPQRLCDLPCSHHTHPFCSFACAPRTTIYLESTLLCVPYVCRHWRRPPHAQRGGAGLRRGAMARSLAWKPMLGQPNAPPPSCHFLGLRTTSSWDWADIDAAAAAGSSSGGAAALAAMMAQSHATIREIFCFVLCRSCDGGSNIPNELSLKFVMCIVEKLLLDRPVYTRTRVRCTLSKTPSLTVSCMGAHPHRRTSHRRRRTS